jgi:hypothetical protein
MFPESLFGYFFSRLADLIISRLINILTVEAKYGKTEIRASQQMGV